MNTGVFLACVSSSKKEEVKKKTGKATTKAILLVSTDNGKDRKWDVVRAGRRGQTMMLHHWILRYVQYKKHCLARISTVQ